jgi:hypothetical protein
MEGPLTQGQSPAEFCRAIMQDYERQWILAQGHARRHPLRVKMLRLEKLMEQSLSEKEFAELLTQAAAGDDWELSLLCADLEPRWRVAQTGQPFIDT